jgi:heterodisulfide reductase subunit C/nitrate reductase gamma subunit
MFISIALYAALAFFVVSLLYKIFNWFRHSITREAGEISTSRRILAALKGIIFTLLSIKIFILLKVCILDVLLNARILREDFFRWLMHICIYVGFLLLVLMHALGQYISASIFENYYSTVNPFLFLRNLFGVMVLFGIAIAVCRRFILKVPRLRTQTMDLYAIIIVVVIIISGFFLEGTKMVSYSIYTEMVEDYSALSDPQKLSALEAYWVEEFGVVSPKAKGPFDERRLEQGRELHLVSCAECHSKAQWAFTGFGLAKIISPFALGLNRTNIHGVLWYIHFFACLIGLAYIPFSKMFHIFASPLSLLTNAVMERGKSDPANIATRQMMELDACTHCGTCSLRCSVAVATEEIPNITILPAEKMAPIKMLALGKYLTDQELKELQEGAYLCTNCYRCTVVCPVGINLQDLWFNVREMLFQKGLPELSILSPLSFYRGLMKEEMIQTEYEKPLMKAKEAIVDKCNVVKEQDTILPLIAVDKTFKSRLNLSTQASTFTVCFGCQTCTNACPVVANYDNPQEILGLLPHQIMHACALGLRDLAFVSNMLWDCITCYQCQEQCPQGVCVTDVLYELKNFIVEYVGEKTVRSLGKKP